MNFKMKFRHTSQKLKVSFNDNSKGFGITFKDFQKATERPDAEVYEGDYDVIPQVDAQTLQTKHKFMLDDVRVKAIPYYEVGNNSGGSTVYIGSLEELLGNTAVLGKARLGLMKLGREN